MFNNTIVLQNMVHEYKQMLHSVQAECNEKMNIIEAQNNKIIELQKCINEIHTSLTKALEATKDNVDVSTKLQLISNEIIISKQLASKFIKD